MDAFEILKDKAVKKLEARKLIADAISDGSFSLDDFCSKAGGLNDKQIATFLEAVERVRREAASALII